MSCNAAIERLSIVALHEEQPNKRVRENEDAKGQGRKLILVEAVKPCSRHGVSFGGIKDAIYYQGCSGDERESRSRETGRCMTRFGITINKPEVIPTCSEWP